MLPNYYVLNKKNLTIKGGSMELELFDVILEAKILILQREEEVGKNMFTATSIPHIFSLLSHNCK